VSESHWGGRSPKGALYVVLVAVALMAGLIALFAWSPWERPSEVDWLVSYEEWSERTETSLNNGLDIARATCEEEFDDEVGNPPGERFPPVAEAARRGCTALTPEGWQRAQSDVVRAIRDVHAAEVPPSEVRDFSELARPIAGREAKVYCWTAPGWAQFFEHYVLVKGDDEVSLRGLADAAGNRIDVEPGVCIGLGRHVAKNRPPALSGENLRLARALIVLAHHAEHLGSPSASETQLECFAVQHVRPLMQERGWDPDYVREIVLQSWQLHYTQLPAQLRTPDCRDGGPLDRNPGSELWP
jgi:hypothetical protein